MSRRSCKACARACGSSGAAIDLSFAQGAEAGLAALSSGPYDVVVADMRMPAMDGASFLRIVMEQQPEVVRIVLSGYTDRANVLRALGVAHQFLSKPCPTDTIADVLSRASALRGLVTDERLRRFMSRLTSLPVERAVSEQLAETLIQPGSSAVSLLRIVEQDLALSAKLMQIVNSSTAGQVKPVGKLDDAVARMDRDTLRALALSSCLVQNVEQAPVDAGAVAGPPARTCAAVGAYRPPAHGPTPPTPSWPSPPPCWPTPASWCSGCGGPSASPS